MFMQSKKRSLNQMTEDVEMKSSTPTPSRSAVVSKQRKTMQNTLPKENLNVDEIKNIFG